MSLSRLEIVFIIFGMNNGVPPCVGVRRRAERVDGRCAGRGRGTAVGEHGRVGRLPNAAGAATAQVAALSQRLGVGIGAAGHALLLRHRWPVAARIADAQGRHPVPGPVHRAEPRAAATGDRRREPRSAPRQPTAQVHR